MALSDLKRDISTLNMLQHVWRDVWTVSEIKILLCWVSMEMLVSAIEFV